MKNALLDIIINSINNNFDYDDIKLKEIRYGLETLYLSIFKLIIIIIISIFIHTTTHLCLLLVTYGILRLTGFGLHTKNSLQCWIFSLSTFTIIPYLIKNLFINNNIYYILSFILLILIIKYAPSDTEKRPLINKKKRIIYKIITSINTLIYIIVILYTKNVLIKKLLFFSILLEVLLILPISYKLLGLKYNNYLSYRRKEVKKWNILSKD